MLLLDMHCTFYLLLSMLLVELNVLRRDMRATRAAEGLQS